MKNEDNNCKWQISGEISDVAHPSRNHPNFNEKITLCGFYNLDHTKTEVYECPFDKKTAKDVCEQYKMNSRCGCCEDTYFDGLFVHSFPKIQT
ncbi:MAG: hypothetical protein AABX88_01355 [Nanoarchaeota archaeon]